MGALAYATQLLGLLPSLISLGVNIKNFVSDGIAKLSTMQAENRDPTPAEWDELNAAIAVLRKQLHSGSGSSPVTTPVPLPDTAVSTMREEYEADAAAKNEGTTMAGWMAWQLEHAPKA